MKSIRDIFSFVIPFFIGLFTITSCDEFELEPVIESNNNVYRTYFHPELDVVVKEDMPLQGFYKDIFMDAGVYLSTRNTLAAANYLGYSLESVSCTDIADTLWQNSVIAGDENDLNERLPYPDGQPRYRMLFVCGGNSQKHGQSLSQACLENMRDFVIHGGSYVDTCAGAFFASCGFDTKKDYPYYLHLWPEVLWSN